MKVLSFSDIFAQPGAVGFLTSAIRANRLPHAMIFAGPVGVGKATCAAALAAWFLCEKPKGDRPCGVCESCRVLPAGNHPDYHVITKELIRVHDKTGKSKATLLAADVIRGELVAPAARTSSMGLGKFFVVEQAELMNAAAQNVLLKTLEEPAGRTLIVLITDSPEFLLPTIRSRCQLVRFGALDEKLVRTELEKRGIDPATAEQAAALSDGSLGGALRLISQQILPAATKLHEQIDAILAGRPAGDVAGWLKQAAESYAERELERDPLSSKESATRTGIALYLALAARRFRQRLTQTNDADELERICQAIDATARCQMYLDGNVNIPVLLGQVAAAWAGEFAAI
jgi:DNA polymerase-3 subunit delta'